MLEAIFGNATAEKALLHIFHYGEIHAAAIASDYGVANTPVLKQLERFENAGILASRTVGKARLYAINPKSLWAKPLTDLLRTAYEAMPLPEKERVFGVRRRPRRKGKAVL